MKSNLLAILVCVALGISAVGCKKGESTTLQKGVALNTPQGWRLHTVTSDGFTVCTPGNWVLESELSPFADSGIDPSQLEGMMNGQGQQDMQAMPEPKGPTTTDTHLVLFDQGSRRIPGETPTQVEFRYEKVGAALLKDETAKMKDRLGKAIKSQQTLQLPIGPCEEFVTKITNVGGDEVFERYYVLCHESNLWTVKFVATNNESAIDIAPEIMKTFRLK